MKKAGTRQPSVQMLAYRDHRGYEYAVVDIDLLIPDPENPRIPIQESTLDTLVALHEKDADGLFTLAKDIVEMEGTSPSELLNVTRSGGAFVVREGNRRIAARRILRNPEQLRGHVTGAELDRWRRLAAQSDAKKLPKEILVVVGDDHDEWVDRRHLGPQGGRGVQQWDPAAKARRAEQRRETKDRTLSLLTALAKSHPNRFANLQPPERTFTTFERLLDSSIAAAHLGVDVDENGNVRLTKGERSLRLLEEALSDLRKAGSEKLTARRIYDAPAITTYLDELDARLDGDEDSTPVVLATGGAAATKAGGRTSTASRSTPRPKDILTQFTKPTAARPFRLYEELKKLRKDHLPNAAIIVTRVLFEITADHYAAENGLEFAGDRNVQVEEEVKGFRKELNAAGVKPSKNISQALDFAASRPKSLGMKLELVIKDLIARKKIDSKEGNAKIRELKDRQVVELLNDAVHRLENVPNMDRVDHILEIMRPIHNAMFAS